MKKFSMPKNQPRKRLGQNFLQDEDVIARIVAAINPQHDDLMVEIGAGLGALTIHLLPALQQLHIVEFDRDLIPQLIRNCGNSDKLIIHQADALRFDFDSLLTAQKKLRIVGNLPYNISSPLIFHLLNNAANIYDMHFMLQQEVVDRLTAEVGSKAYGRLTIMLQYFCRAEKLFTVPPQAFYPKPKVTSAIVRLIPHQKLPAVAKNFAYFALIVKTAFNQRRKTLRNALKTIISADELTRLGIDFTLRPEQLTIKDYVNIANLGEANGDVRNR